MNTHLDDGPLDDAAQVLPLIGAAQPVEPPAPSAIDLVALAAALLALMKHELRIERERLG